VWVVPAQSSFLSNQSPGHDEDQPVEAMRLRNVPCYAEWNFDSVDATQGHGICHRTERGQRQANFHAAEFIASNATQSTDARLLTCQFEYFANVVALRYSQQSQCLYAILDWSPGSANLANGYGKLPSVCSSNTISS
jgi:hypothetical protein